MYDRIVAALYALLFLFVMFGPDDFPPLGPSGQVVSGGSEYQYEMAV